MVSLHINGTNPIPIRSSIWDPNFHYNSTREIIHSIRKVLGVFLLHSNHLKIGNLCTYGNFWNIDLNIGLNETHWCCQQTELIASNELEMWKKPWAFHHRLQSFCRFLGKERNETKFYRRMFFKPCLPFHQQTFSSTPSHMVYVVIS